MTGSRRRVASAADDVSPTAVARPGRKTVPAALPTGTGSAPAPVQLQELLDAAAEHVRNARRGPARRASGPTRPGAGELAGVGEMYPPPAGPQAAVGDLLAWVVKKFTAVRHAGPLLRQAESNLVRRFCAMLGYGAGSFGRLTADAASANAIGLRCAIRRGGEQAGGHPTVCVSAEGQAGITAAAVTAGLPPAQVRVIGVDSSYAMDVGELADRIMADRAAGLAPVAVVATAGTSGSGAVDDLSGIAALCRAEGIWLHVDARFGGFFRITARGREALRGIDEADSISVDAHPSLFLPPGSCALLVKDLGCVGDTFAAAGAAYPALAEDPGPVDSGSHTPGMGGRLRNDDILALGPGGEVAAHPDARGLGPLPGDIRRLLAWLQLEITGVAAFERFLDEKLDLAAYLEERLPRIRGIEVIRRHPLHLPVVAFKLRADGRRAEDRVNARLCELVHAGGGVGLATAHLPGHGLAVRACTLHPQACPAAVDRILDDVERSVSHLCAPEPVSAR